MRKFVDAAAPLPEYQGVNTRLAIRLGVVPGDVPNAGSGWLVAER
jgi:hypothetical protein